MRIACGSTLAMRFGQTSPEPRAAKIDEAAERRHHDGEDRRARPASQPKSARAAGGGRPARARLTIAVIARKVIGRASFRHHIS